MKVCLKLPTRNLLLDPSDSVRAVSSNLAADVLLNGQGNSGTILSHFFVSFASQVKETGLSELTVQQFVDCLVATGSKMNDAVSNPVEGTLLSVSRDACLRLADAGPFSNLRQLLDAWVDIANEELAKTPDQLIVDGVKVLEKAGVVDSGAQGFVYLIDGMHQASKGELPEASDPDLFKTAAITSNDDAAVNLKVDHTLTDSKFRFCTEAVVLLKDSVDPKSVLEVINRAADEEGLGDSIASVAAPAKGGDGEMIKIHIHSNEPQEIFDRLRPFSVDPELKKEKVEGTYTMSADSIPYAASQTKGQKLNGPANHYYFYEMFRHAIDERIDARRI